MFATLFEFLFKYPQAVFARGELVLASPRPQWMLWALIAAAVAGLAVLVGVRHRRSPLAAWRLAALWLMDSLLIALLLLLLWEPSIAITELKPRQNIVAVVIDGSRSMGIAADRATREEQAVAALKSGALQRLGELYQTRLYRLGAELTRIRGLEELGPPSAPATHIGSSLEQLVAETAELPLGAIVLLSDGGENSGSLPRSALEALRSRHVPVFTVGFGSPDAAHDIELEDASVASRALAGSRLVATVTLRQSGFRGRKPRLSVSEGGKLLASREIALEADGKLQREELTFNVGAAGSRTLEFAVEPQPGEQNRANNTLTRLVSVVGEPHRVLYFEGEPRWEYKFIRRAAGDDPQLELTSMLRTTENKIYRQGIRDPKELADGFPTREEDLFAYQALVIGSVDAGYFTPAQQQLMLSFVDRRGGGLLLLGGRQSLADGVWGGSRVAEALPVVLPDAHDTFQRVPATVSLTPAGADSLICRLVDDPLANTERWRKLPYLMDYQDPGRAKPAAVVLAEMHVPQHPAMPLLITEAYGRGRSAVLATGGTWRWQMSLPLGDNTHELFWQQLLRWLVADAPDHVVAAVSEPLLLDAAHEELSAEVRDATYLPAADAHVAARVIGPGGTSSELDLAPAPNAPGRYQAQWTAAAPGLYVAEVTAHRGAEEIGRGTVAFRRLDGVAESFHTGQNRELLEQLAASTGGRYLEPAELPDIARTVPYSQGGITVRQLKELWNMPALFLLMLALKAGEWLLRRAWGVV